MALVVGLTRIFAVAAIVGALAGCAAGDHFASRLSHYNTEAEKAQDQAILLNVLRASKRRPLSFTELQNVTSSGTPSGSVGFTVPLAQNGAGAASTFSPNLALSGGPTLSAGFINTQEFYQGMLRPLQISTIDLFLQRGISPNLLFNLFFSRIIVKRIPGPGGDTSIQTFTAMNDVSNPDRQGAFQTLIEVLLNKGLATGPDKADSTTLGPPLTDRDLTSTDLLIKANSAGLQVNKADWCDLEDADLASLASRYPIPVVKLKAQCAAIAEAQGRTKGDDALIARARTALLAALVAAKAPTSVYRIEKADASGGFRFCIAGPRSLDGRTAVNPGVCGPDAPVVKPAQGKSARNSLVLTRDKIGAPGAPVDVLCDALAHLANSAAPLNCAGDWAGAGFEIELEPRSTYSVMYYLGEIVRVEGRPGAPPLLVKVGDRLTAIPAGSCAFPGQRPSGSPAFHCQTIFYLHPGRAARHGYLSVRYDGEDYAVASDGIGDKTNEVLDIVNELIALNHSSKDSPTSSLLTVVGVH